MSFFTHPETLVVPETELRGCRGFSLHIGSSNLKFTYIGHIEKHESLNPEHCKASLEMRTASLDKLDDVIKFIKDNILEQRHGRHRFRFQAILTGWRGPDYQERLHEELGVDIKLVDSTVAYSRFHHFGICDIGRQTFLHHVIKCPEKSEPLSAETVLPHLNQTPALVRGNIEGAGTEHPGQFDSDYWDKMSANFPYLLCAVGSDVTYIKVDDSGRADEAVLMRSGYGGSTFQATATLATGVKDYPELQRLANSGDHRAAGFSRRLDNLPERSTECHVDVDVLAAETAVAGGPDKTVMIHPLENIVTGSDLSQADVVSALMRMTCENLVSTALLLARKHGINKVYFTGSFVEENSVLKTSIKQAPVHDMKHVGPELLVGLTRYPRYACSLGALLDGLNMMKFFVECWCPPCHRPAIPGEPEGETCPPPGADQD